MRGGVCRHPMPVRQIARDGLVSTADWRFRGTIHPLMHFTMAVGKSEIAAHGMINSRPIYPLRQRDTDGEGGVVLTLTILLNQGPDIRRAKRGEARRFAVSLVWLVPLVRLAAIEPGRVDR